MIGESARRRALLGGGVAALAGAALAACTSGGEQGTSGAAGTAAPSKGPISIDVLTRPGVSSPTGHSQWYQNTTVKKFTPETNITVNLIDADPDVTAKLQILAAAGTPPDGSWLAVVADGSGGRTDVWTDPRLLAFDPIYSTIVKAYPQGAGSLRQPANFRRTDLLKAVNEELAAYWKGQVSVQDATSKAVQAGNTVLAM
jgi:hypothetical protein